ncbi:transcriptional regulator, PadR family [Oceanobacillus limi]|uniref:Transcriptional regulator, PadR family n=1 Tax=Oceanobacillus limi TaxID=930131 RepID=A0A1I0B7U8_9BACI|nr:helix-turn-helix transcriptional regulator [Oceanobacillus limi]SET02960.1 transcriptional regulator, PadR family [Oceanobacillus limi]
MSKQPEDYIPLSQATYYILLSLREVRHGYGIMQDVEMVSKGEVSMGAGTLYGALGKLEKQLIIKKVHKEGTDRRKYYTLTSLGKCVLQLEYRRLTSLVENAQQIINELGECKDDGEKI